MDIDKLQQIAFDNELEIVDQKEIILLNSYRNENKYTLYYKDEPKYFYKAFMTELLKNVRSRDFFDLIKEDPKGYSELFKSLAYLTEEYVKSTKGGK